MMRKSTKVAKAGIGWELGSSFYEGFHILPVQINLDIGSVMLRLLRSYIIHGLKFDVRCQFVRCEFYLASDLVAFSRLLLEL